MRTDSTFPADGPERKAGIQKVHTLDFPSSAKVILREYAQDFQAYQAFQTQARAEEMRERIYREKNSLFFVHGAFFGELRPEVQALIPLALFKERISFSPEEPFRKPLEFHSFPLAGQIPHSERVVSAEFLGLTPAATVFLMAYECHEDTAYLFRGKPPFPEDTRAWMKDWKGRIETSKWSREVRFTGVTAFGQPLLFWNRKGEFLGVLGCFDSQLALKQAEKLKKMAVLLENL